MAFLFYLAEVINLLLINDSGDNLEINDSGDALEI